VDTGAGGIWLDRDFVRAAGVAGKPGKPDVGDDGRAVETEALPPLAIGLGAWSGRVAGARAFAMPPSLLSSGIVGIFNPVRLLESGVVVVDLPSSKLEILERGPADLAAWLAAAFPGYDFETFKRRVGFLPPVDDPDRDYYSVVNGSLAGRPEGPVLLDSGAGGIVFRDSYLGLKAGTVLRPSPAVRLGTHELRASGIRSSPHREGVDVIGSLGLRAIRRLVVVLPAKSDRIILGFPRRRRVK
jgi:hypothetical protein